MLVADVEEVVVRDNSTGLLHEAIRLYGGDPQLHPDCRVGPDREVYDDLPANFSDRQLCVRCFGGKEK